MQKGKKMFQKTSQAISIIYKKIDKIQEKNKTKIISACFLVIALVALSSFHKKSLDNWIIAISNLVMAFCAFSALIKATDYFSSFAAKDAYDATKKIKFEILPGIVSENYIFPTCLDIKSKLELLIQYPEKVDLADVVEQIKTSNIELHRANSLLAQYITNLKNQSEIIKDSHKHLENTSTKEYQEIHQKGVYVWRLTNKLNNHLTHALNDIFHGNFDYTSTLNQINGILDASGLLTTTITEELNK
ncbi:hypothetical protein [Klebsiella aerogenes]|uniref:hypothetical protein n=1 Tax=Klebsiella aerogenes TaxID=548 RepID=UPI0012DF33BB|nr:hypothetical protein [Klebsiella aerogenes]